MSKFQVGYAEVNINPPLGAGVSGYYIPRYGKGFLDDLMSEVLVFSCGGKKIALISIHRETMPLLVYKRVPYACSHNNILPLLSPLSRISCMWSWMNIVFCFCTFHIILFLPKEAPHHIQHIFSEKVNLKTSYFSKESFHFSNSSFQSCITHIFIIIRNHFINGIPVS